jgi:putative heme iron utilization protein
VQLSDHLDWKFHWLQVFIKKNEYELVSMLPRILASLRSESILWVNFPKGSSKIKIYLTRDKGWDSLRGSNMKWINLVSLNATWSAISLRPYCESEVRQPFR